MNPVDLKAFYDRAPEASQALAQLQSYAAELPIQKQVDRLWYVLPRQPPYLNFIAYCLLNSFKASFSST